MNYVDKKKTQRKWWIENERKNEWNEEKNIRIKMEHNGERRILTYKYENI